MEEEDSRNARSGLGRGCEADAGGIEGVGRAESLLKNRQYAAMRMGADDFGGAVRFIGACRGDRPGENEKSQQM